MVMLALFLAAVVEHFAVAMLAQHVGVDTSHRLDFTLLNWLQRWSGHIFQSETFISAAVVIRTAVMTIAMGSAIAKFGAALVIAVAIFNGAFKSTK